MRCWSPSTKRHIRPLHTGSWFTLFRLTVALLSWLHGSDSPTCCEPQTLFTQDPAIKNLCKESDACSKERIFLTFFTFLYMVSTACCWTYRQTWFLIQLKTQTFRLFAAFLVEIINRQKPFYFNSHSCWAVNMKNWENFLTNPPLLHCKRCWSQLFLTSRQQSALLFIAHNTK